MRRRIEIDGKFYRYRRGRLVQIPDEWLDRGLTYPQTIRKRRSKRGQGKSWTRPVARKAHKRRKYNR